MPLNSNLRRTPDHPEAGGELNSRSLPIHPSEGATEAFWSWFGDSGVVDGLGRPLVLFHGSNSDIDAFSEGQRGIFFTPRAKTASAYANEEEPGAVVYAVYLRMERPFKATVSELRRLLNGKETEIKAAAAAAYRDPSGVIEDFEDSIVWARDLVTRYIREAGHDGIIFPRDLLPIVHMDGDYSLQRSYAVFSPEQIKSAIGSDGTFQPCDAVLIGASHPALTNKALSRVAEENLALGHGVECDRADRLFAALKATIDPIKTSPKAACYAPR